MVDFMYICTRWLKYILINLKIKWWLILVAKTAPYFIVVYTLFLLRFFCKGGIILSIKEKYMILEEINKANVQAFKDKNTLVKDVISVIKARAKLLEVDKRVKGEVLTDADVATLIQKLIKEYEEAVENYKKVNNMQEAEYIEKQIEFCKGFLPKTLSKEEIKDIIMGMEDKSVPTVMKHFKANYAGRVDMREVQEVLKTL